MGYGGQTEIIGDTSAFDGTTNTAPSTTSPTYPTTGTGEEYSGGILGDNLYLKDYQLVGNVYKSDTTTYGSNGLKAHKAGSLTSANYYWLASRHFYYGSPTIYYFSGRFVYSNGGLGYERLRFLANSWWVGLVGHAVRPILTLRSGLTISGGSGTEDNPYTLS